MNGMHLPVRWHDEQLFVVESAVLSVLSAYLDEVLRREFSDEKPSSGSCGRIAQFSFFQPCEMLIFFHPLSKNPSKCQSLPEK
jgi:hypothetical protein